MKILPINLLPEDMRLRARYAIWQRVTIQFGVIGLGLVLLSFVALLPSYFEVSLRGAEAGRLQEIEEQNPLRPKAESVAKNIASANSEIKTLKAALVGEQPVSQIVMAILAQVPSGITVKHIEFHRGSRQLSLAGFALRRDDILEFEKKLKTLSLIQDVVSPLSNIIKGENIAFSIQITVKQ